MGGHELSHDNNNKDNENAEDISFDHIDDDAYADGVYVEDYLAAAQVIAASSIMTTATTISSAIHEESPFEESVDSRRLVDYRGRSFGDKKILVSRIEANDSTPTSSSEVFSDNWLQDSAVSFNSQMRECSYNQFRVDVGSSLRGTTRVNRNARNLNSDQKGEFVAEAKRQLQLDIENAGFGRLDDYDFVVFCLPPGFIGDGWWAHFDSRTSNAVFFNDYHCNNVNAQMHGKRLGRVDL